VPMIMWPKDRVLFNRLELIIQMFENGGEWPQRAAFVHPAQNQQTPAANPLSISNLVNPLTPHAHFLLAEQRKHMMSPSLLDHSDNMSYPLDNPDDNSNSESDFLRYNANTPGAGNGKKPKRGRPPKYEPVLGMTPEHTSRRNQHLTAAATTDSRDGYSSTDDYDDNNSNDIPATKSKFLEPGEVLRPQGTQKSSLKGDMKIDDRSGSTKRGRKSSIVQPKSPQSMPMGVDISQQDAATAAALAAMFLAPGQDPDERVTVINVENGSRLTGSKAPRRQDLPMWLISHPNYLPDESEIINLALKQGQMNAVIDQEAANRNSRSGKSLR